MENQKRRPGEGGAGPKLGGDRDQLFYQNGGDSESRRVVIRHGVDDRRGRGRRSIEVFVDPPCDPPCDTSLKGCITFPSRRLHANMNARELSRAHGGIPIVNELEGTPRGGYPSFAAPWTRGARRGG